MYEKWIKNNSRVKQKQDLLCKLKSLPCVSRNNSCNVFILLISEEYFARKYLKLFTIYVAGEMRFA